MADANTDGGAGVLRRLRVAARSRVRRHRRLYGLVRLLKYGPYRGFTDDRARRALLERAEREGWRVLYLGSGGRRQPGMVNLDITWETGPDVVGDGFRLPFAEGTFDAIFCEAVIEHVADPERFLALASRVLKPGGVWYLEAPLLQPWHGGSDFQRWTLEGFRDALRRAGLVPLGAGIHMGPGFGLMWIVREWLALLLSGGFGPVRAVLRWGLGFALSPLLLLDPVLMALPASAELACANWHIARRPPAGDGEAP